MAIYLEKTALIDHNIFLKTYRATDDDYKKFMMDVNEQLKLGLLFDNVDNNKNSLTSAIQSYIAIRDGLYLNKAQKVSLDYKENGNIIIRSPIFLTNDDYLRLKLLSSLDEQNKTIKAYQRLQSLIIGNPSMLNGTQLNTNIFTFELYRDYVLGLFDTVQGELPSKAEKLLRGYQKSYEESMEILEDLVTSNNPLRSGYYRMYNQSPEVRKTVDAFKRAVLEKAAIDANDRSEFKQMQLGLMKLLQYGSLDDRLRKQILALIKQNAEGIATVTGGAADTTVNYAIELNNLLSQWNINNISTIQKPPVTSLGEIIVSGFQNLLKRTKDEPITPVYSTLAKESIVTPDDISGLESSLTKLSGEVTHVVSTLNPAIPKDEIKLKMYEELLTNLEFLLELVMNIKLASVTNDVNLQSLYVNLKQALQNVIEETKALNQLTPDILERISKALVNLTDLPQPVKPPITREELAAKQAKIREMLDSEEAKFINKPPTSVEDAKLMAELEVPVTPVPAPIIEEVKAPVTPVPAPIVEEVKAPVTPVPAPIVEEVKAPDTLFPETGITSPEDVTTSVTEYQAPKTTYEELSKTHEVIDVPGDGWCFFYAVNGALGKPYKEGTLSPDGDDYKATAEKLIDNINKYYYSIHNEILYSDVDKQNKKWADTNVMNITAETLDKCIYIYLQYNDENNIKQYYPIPIIFSRTGTKPCEENTLYLSLSIGNLKLKPEDNLIDIINKSNDPIGNHFGFFKNKSVPPIWPNLIRRGLTPIGKSRETLPPIQPILNPIYEKERLPATPPLPSNKQQNQINMINILNDANIGDKLFTRTDSKFTVDELNAIVNSLPIEQANLLRIAFVVANIQESVQSIDRDMNGLTKDFFDEMKKYFNQTRNYAGIDNPIKQIQKDLYCILVEQLYALHQKPGAIYTYSADVEGRNFTSIDPIGTDLIILDTILPKIELNGIMYPSYMKMKESINPEIYLESLGDITPTPKASGLNQIFIELQRIDNSNNRKKFLINFINYIVNKYKYKTQGRTPEVGKQILYKLLLGMDKWGSYANISSRGGDKNLLEEIKDMDGGANAEPIQLDKLKEAIEKLDEYRKTLRSTQEELNSWKEKYTTYNKSVDITKNFKGDKEIDQETIQILKRFAEEINVAYQNAIDTRNAVITEEDELKELEKQATDEEESDKEAKKQEKQTRVAEKKELREKAEATFKAELEQFLKNTFALSDTNRSETINKFVSLLKKALPGEIAISSATLDGLTEQLLSIKNLIEKLESNTVIGNNYIDSEIVSIYEFLKGKSADLKKFNTERFNAMDKTIREVYQFILTTNKPLEIKDKFKTKRIEFEALLDGAENIADEQRFKDLIIDPKKKNMKGLLPTIKDIKRLLETDIDYFTSLFQQKATSILKEQELKQKQAELQAHRTQPGPFAALFGQQAIRGGQHGGTDIDKENRTKLDYYFGIEKTENEDYEQYKDVQLYLDALNKLIDSYKFSLTTVTDPAAALALSGDKSLFNMIYDKYVKSSEDETKGEFIASNELATSLEVNNLVPRDVLRVSLRDKIVILFTTLFMRLITLSIVEFMIEKGVLKNLKYTVLAYLGFFSIIFIAFTALVNLDMYRLRIVFNYINFHANSDKVISYLILLWAFGGMIYYIIVNINQDISVTNTSEDVKARLIYRIQVVSLIVWLFLIIMVFIL